MVIINTLITAIEGKSYCHQRIV